MRNRREHYGRASGTGIRRPEWAEIGQAKLRAGFLALSGRLDRVAVDRAAFLRILGLASRPAEGEEDTPRMPVISSSQAQSIVGGWPGPSRTQRKRPTIAITSGVRIDPKT